jgi:hypothetical protein
MNPKEKAKELFDYYVELSGIYIGDYENEKQMCLIAVNEIINLLIKLDFTYEDNVSKYYREVKTEIEKL